MSLKSEREAETFFTNKIEKFIDNRTVLKEVQKKHFRQKKKYLGDKITKKIENK